MHALHPSPMPTLFARHPVFAGALVALVACLAWGCPGSGGDRGPSLDSNTNWLTECSADRDCGGTLTCECGVCTTVCSDDCSAFEGGVCVGAGDPGRDRICPATVAPICLRGCFADAECGEDATCVDQRCLPRWATSQQDLGVDVDAGTVDADPNNDADAGTDPVEDAPVTDADTDDVNANDTGADAEPDTTTEPDTREDADPPPDLCPGGGQFACGARLGVTRRDLYACDGERGYTFARTCVIDCVYVEGGDDVCVDACDEGVPLAYCGSELGLPPDHLYSCSANLVAPLGPCVNGCDPDFGAGGSAACR